MADTHLDHNVLSALQDVMEEEYPVLLDTFLSDSEERLLALRKAGDAEQLGATAHSFKGSSSNMGALRLAELCSQLEQRAKTLSLADVEQLVADIDGEFAIIRPLYEAERQRSLAHTATVRRF
ncbi:MULTISPECIES: Hpt domain-containing protein [unclassified Pseudomonas]|uniref:Hpt domain-containing protein n=1 Tax=unclassified Pseudomonas TaxID=196821 RepID=UPI002AC98310|nr:MULTISPECIES: Hpt domain-containing protein [unclassified Pseudomonas]MEB0045432.1 Hpt domain-containing protein [Pseudomonas sp. Dout3]MEB0097050.1 Hpt domain-containing protein [Pseudomonas sp. DC1.2]WPX60516.1 Hpt domain-containing protein [Pseudomonas sp. DC1.2]